MKEPCSGTEHCKCGATGCPEVCKEILYRKDYHSFIINKVTVVKKIDPHWYRRFESSKETNLKG